MQNLSTFQLIVLGICGALVVLGVGIFSLFNRYSGNQVGTVAIWGTLPQKNMDQLLQDLRSADHSFQNVTYLEKSAKTYDADLLDAIAGGRAPDLTILSQEEILPFVDKL